MALSTTSPSWWTVANDIDNEGDLFWVASTAPVAEFLWHAGQPNSGVSGNCVFNRYVQFVLCINWYSYFFLHISSGQVEMRLLNKLQLVRSDMRKDEDEQKHCPRRILWVAYILCLEHCILLICFLKLKYYRTITRW